MRCFIVSIFIVFFVYSDAGAITFGNDYINNFNQCTHHPSNMSYCDDVVNMFTNKMTSLGHSHMYTWADNNAWAVDLIEDNKGGIDYAVSDAFDMFTSCSHGSWGSTPITLDPALGGGTVCCTSYLSFCTYNGSTTYGNPVVDLSQIVLGEAAFYAYPNHGHARYVMLHNCESMSWAPSSWMNQLFYGLDFAMGYVFSSYDHEYTDETGYDWATVAMRQSNIWDFKSAWFWATEDWYFTSRVAVVSGGEDLDQMYYNIDNYYRTNPGPHTWLSPYQWWDTFGSADHRG